MTNYRIFNDKGVQLFKNKNTACFYEFTSTNPIPEGCEWEPDRYMEVYINNLKEEEVVFFIKFLNNHRIKVSYKNTGRTYTFRFNFNDYNSKAHLKLALHFIRFFYESTRLVTSFYDYFKNSKRPTLVWEVLQFLNMMHRGGHSYLGYYFVKPINKKELFKEIDSWKDEKYNNNEVSKLFQKMSTNKMYTEKSGFSKTMKYKEYKKFIEKL